MTQRRAQYCSNTLAKPRSKRRFSTPKLSMKNHLSIRSYSRQRKGHSHDYHQLVLPVRGVINLEVENYRGKVAPGECVVIRQGEMHHFTADEEARFVVADISELPANLTHITNLVFSVSAPLVSYLNFVEKQLEYKCNEAIEKALCDTFMLLLAEHVELRQLDARIRASVEYILKDLTAEHTISDIASVACLSPTQLKKLFKAQMGTSVFGYITQARMEKAKTLLVHTDYPIALIAEKVGYLSASSFSRRFSEHFGLSPKAFLR